MLDTLVPSVIPTGNAQFEVHHETRVGHLARADHLLLALRVVLAVILGSIVGGRSWVAFRQASMHTSMTMALRLVHSPPTDGSSVGREANLGAMLVGTTS